MCQVWYEIKPKERVESYLWIYLIHQSGKETIDSFWKVEVKLGRCTKLQSRVKWKRLSYWGQPSVSFCVPLLLWKMPSNCAKTAATAASKLAKWMFEISKLKSLRSSCLGRLKTKCFARQLEFVSHFFALQRVMRSYTASPISPTLTSRSCSRNGTS